MDQLETFKALFKMSAAENDKKQKRNFYNSASNSIDSQYLAWNACFWRWEVSVSKYQVIQDAKPSQLFWPPTCGCYVTNEFESTGEAINTKK